MEPSYKDKSLMLLELYSVRIGDFVEVITSSKGSYEGILMPRYEYADDRHIVIKLKNGYNIGINLARIRAIRRISEGVKPTFTSPPEPRVLQTLPRISIIGIGGTIASRVDYRTGAVHPALSATELYSTIPELSTFAQIDCDVLYSIFSENLTTEHWSSMALKVAEKVRSGVKGVVLTHGTDTMAYTSAALSFALPNVPIPVVLVGSQRSSDRPSSDAALNLIGAVTVAAQAPFSGVYVVMHSTMDDSEIAVHLGTKVRKNHTSRRDAFESVNILPAAYIKGKSIEQILPSLPPRRDMESFEPKTNFQEKVALLKFYPGFDPDLINLVVEKKYQGIILEGTGLGHISRACFEAIRQADEAGLIVGMTSQCIWGGVRMTVYDTGRDLLSIGVLPLGDMLPETALIKMMWVLANSKNRHEAKLLMLRNIASEYSVHQSLERRPAR